MLNKARASIWFSGSTILKLTDRQKCNYSGHHQEMKWMQMLLPIQKIFFSAFCLYIIIYQVVCCLGISLPKSYLTILFVRHMSSPYIEMDTAIDKSDDNTVSGDEVYLMWVMVVQVMRTVVTWIKFDSLSVWRNWKWASWWLQFWSVRRWLSLQGLPFN